jgi:hypothetical protein
MPPIMGQAFPRLASNNQPPIEHRTDSAPEGASRERRGSITGASEDRASRASGNHCGKLLDPSPAGSPRPTHASFESDEDAMILVFRYTLSGIGKTASWGPFFFPSVSRYAGGLPGKRTLRKRRILADPFLCRGKESFFRLAHPSFQGLCSSLSQVQGRRTFSDFWRCRALDPPTV